jgi:hypothetical protein
LGSSIAELVRTAPDWTNADPLSTEVIKWLHRAYHAVQEVDPVEAGVLKLYVQHLCDDTQRFSADIIDTLQRVAWKVEKCKPGW